MSWKENLKKCTSFKERKGTGYIKGNRLQLSFVYKSMSQISFHLFCSGDEKLLSVP